MNMKDKTFFTKFPVFLHKQKILIEKMCQKVPNVNKFLDFLPGLEKLVKNLQFIYERKIDPFKQKYEGILNVDDNAGDMLE